MNRMIQLRNQIAEAYRLNQHDLAFELEEEYNDCRYELEHQNTVRHQYVITKRPAQVIA